MQHEHLSATLYFIRMAHHKQSTNHLLTVLRKQTWNLGLEPSEQGTMPKLKTVFYASSGFSVFLTK